MFPISPITGQQHALKAKDSLKGGIYAGAGNALEKLADFAIKRAESMSPVIVVASVRVVDVVFRKGFDLKQDGTEESIRLLPPTIVKSIALGDKEHNDCKLSFPRRQEFRFLPTQV